MKIVLIDQKADDEVFGVAQTLLPQLLVELAAKGNEIHVAGQFAAFEEDGITLHSDWLASSASGNSGAKELARLVNDLKPDIYVISSADEVGWSALPMIDPQIATVAVGYTDSERVYAPVRHYRQFLTRVVGLTPEVCVGFVLGCVIEKERVEWISYEECETENGLRQLGEAYQLCFEKAAADAAAAPRETFTDYPLPASARPSWFGRLIGKLRN